MATHSGVLAWRVPGMWEPSGLPSMGSHRVRHDWANKHSIQHMESKKKVLMSLFAGQE